MRVFVTGKNGFIAKHLIPRLISEGHIVDSSSKNDNITDKLINFKPDIIFHLAAECYNTDIMFESNLLLTIKILDYCKVYKVHKLIIFGSSSEYGRKSRPITESDHLEPTNMYEATKGCASLMSRSYSMMYGIKTVIIRPMSVYGPHEKPNRFMALAFSGKLKYINNAVHDWTYIDDFIDATICILHNENDLLFDIVNIGIGIQRTNKEVVEIIETITNQKMNVIEDDTYKKSYDSMTWVCDPSYLKTRYSFIAKITLEDGLRKYYKWIINQ
jgi:nucleoside-diphosphate-sugar epimerase